MNMLKDGIQEAEDSRSKGGKSSRSGRREPETKADKLKRRIFKKLGYEGFNKDEAVPDEIFQMLWLIQQNEA